MDKIQKIKDKLKDSPELLDELEKLINAPRERNEIYIYCLKRETLEGEIHYIPLITLFGQERYIMACNDVKMLQEDYKKEVEYYKLNGLPLIIIEVPFYTYVNLSTIIETQLNSTYKLKDIFKKVKMELLLNNIDIAPDFMLSNMYLYLIKEHSYCKCLDEKLNIVDCSNYKPIKPTIQSYNN